MWSHYNGRFSSNAIIDHSFIDCPKWELCGVAILGKLHNFIISFKCFILPYSIGVVLTLFNGTGLNVLIFHHRIWPFCEFKVWLIIYLWHRCTVCNEKSCCREPCYTKYLTTLVHHNKWGNLVEFLFTIQCTLCTICENIIGDLNEKLWSINSIIHINYYGQVFLNGRYLPRSWTVLMQSNCV